MLFYTSMVSVLGATLIGAYAIRPMEREKLAYRGDSPLDGYEAPNEEPIVISARRHLHVCQAFFFIYFTAIAYYILTLIFSSPTEKVEEALPAASSLHSHLFFALYKFAYCFLGIG